MSFLLLVVSSANGQKPTPTPAEQSFLMAIEDVFYINGRGTVATGKVERGTVKTGDTVEIVGIRATKTTTVTVTAFKKNLAEGKAGDNVGLLLKGIEKTEVEPGQLVVKPGSMKAYTEVNAKIDLLLAADGGRKTPIAAGYRSLIYFRNSGFSAVLTLPKGVDTVAPGTKGVNVGITLEKSAPLEKGQTFSINEGGRTIGTGVVTSLVVK